MNPASLIVGNRNTSSWSLRAWLALRHAGADFDVTVVRLDRPDFATRMAALSPTGKVPVLRHEGRVIWDSLAIAEYANETFAGGRLWPDDAATRAHGRAVSAEMHSGFAALRERMPMGWTLPRAEAETETGAETGAETEADGALATDIARIQALWRDCRERHAARGPWLLGAWSLADAMYAPVVLRFHTYCVPVGDVEARYMATAFSDPHLRQWLDAAEHE